MPCCAASAELVNHVGACFAAEVFDQVDERTGKGWCGACVGLVESAGERTGGGCCDFAVGVLLDVLEELLDSRLDGLVRMDSERRLRRLDPLDQPPDVAFRDAERFSERGDGFAGLVAVAQRFDG